MPGFWVSEPSLLVYRGVFSFGLKVPGFSGKGLGGELGLKYCFIKYTGLRQTEEVRVYEACNLPRSHVVII